MSTTSERVVIGMNPHKRSATVEVMAADEAIRGGGGFGTDRDGHAAMLRYAKQWPEWVWAYTQRNEQPMWGRLFPMSFRCRRGRYTRDRHS